MTPLFHQENSCIAPPIFILGCARSGNTLLRAILNSHAEICIPPESHVLGSLARSWKKISHDLWPNACKAIVREFASHPHFDTWGLNVEDLFWTISAIDKHRQSLSAAVESIFSLYAQKYYPESSRWGDKTPSNVFNLDWLYTLFPSAQYVHVYRDGRAVVESLLRNRLYHSLDEACARWIHSLDQVKRFRLRRRTQWHEVRYEDLVNHPERTVRAICSFLQLRYSGNMLNYWKGGRYMGDIERFSYHRNARMPITNDFIDLWRDTLSAGARRRIEELMASGLNELGYIH